MAACDRIPSRCGLPRRSSPIGSQALQRLFSCGYVMCLSAGCANMPPCNTQCGAAREAPFSAQLRHLKHVLPPAAHPLISAAHPLISAAHPSLLGFHSEQVLSLVARDGSGTGLAARLCSCAWRRTTTAPSSRPPAWAPPPRTAWRPARADPAPGTPRAAHPPGRAPGRPTAPRSARACAADRARNRYIQVLGFNACDCTLRPRGPPSASASGFRAAGRERTGRL